MPENQYKRVVAGSLFALFVAFLVGALTVFGVINLTLGHVFIILATLVGILIICTELFPAKPTQHKVWYSIALCALMGLIDFGIIHLKGNTSPEPETPKLSDSARSEIERLNQMFADRDETGLREYFGFTDMLDLNLRMYSARVKHYQETGDPKFDLTPYVGNQNMKIDSSIAGEHAKRQKNGAISYDFDPHQIALIVVSNNWKPKSVARVREFGRFAENYHRQR